MMQSMNTPRTRAEFERRFHLLKEQMKQEKIHFSASAALGIDGILKVRLLPNERIDFLSVNESVRCLVNTSVQFNSEAMEEMINNLENQDSQNTTTEHIGNSTNSGEKQN
ncbi:AVAST type 1 anti-phage system protein Avs1c [Methylomonas sp. YC3]